MPVAGLRCTLVVLLTSMTVPASAQSRRPACAIDMGSNSFRRIVATFENGRYAQARVEVRTLGVGDDVARNSGRIGEAKIGEIVATLTAFRSACENDQAAPIKAVGTAAFRQAANGQDVVAAARKLGIDLEIASERRESELAYLVGSLGRDGYAVVDNGSRSIELVSRAGGALRHLVLNLGYRTAWETFFASATDPAAAVLAFQKELRQHSTKAGFMKGMQTLVGVEFAEMADGLFGKAPAEGRVFKLQELEAKLSSITTSSTDAFQALKKSKDIDRSLPRLVVALTVMKDFGYSELRLTERELGAGLIIEAGLARSAK